MAARRTPLLEPWPEGAPPLGPTRGCSPTPPARATGVGLAASYTQRTQSVQSTVLTLCAPGVLCSTRSVAKPIYLRIVEWYATEIRAKRLKAGDWLPTQPQLAEQWDCSLTPVRHALGVLENMGLIENLQGKGARVA